MRFEVSWCFVDIHKAMQPVYILLNVIGFVFDCLLNIWSLRRVRFCQVKCILLFGLFGKENASQLEHGGRLVGYVEGVGSLIGA